jgi:hypothetical protein
MLDFNQTLECIDEAKHEIVARSYIHDYAYHGWMGVRTQEDEDKLAYDCEFLRQRVAERFPSV